MNIPQHRIHSLRTCANTCCRAVLLLCSLFIFSCGGGTAGTSGTGAFQFSGEISSSEGTGLGGVQVTVLESGQSTETAADGTFDLSTDIDGSTATLLLSQGTQDAITTVSDLPSHGAKVTVNVSIDTTQFTVSSQSVQVNPRPHRKPSPVPSSAPTLKPSPTPETKPTPSSGATTLLHGKATWLTLGGRGAQSLGDILLVFNPLGISTTTDSDGNFSVEIPASAATLTLLVTLKDKTFNAKGPLTIPAYPMDITLKVLVVNARKNPELPLGAAMILEAKTPRS